MLVYIRFPLLFHLVSFVMPRHDAALTMFSITIKVNFAALMQLALQFYESVLDIIPCMSLVL